MKGLMGQMKSGLSKSMGGIREIGEGFKPVVDKVANTGGFYGNKFSTGLQNNKERFGAISEQGRDMGAQAKGGFDYNIAPKAKNIWSAMR